MSRGPLPTQNFYPEILSVVSAQIDQVRGVRGGITELGKISVVDYITAENSTFYACKFRGADSVCFTGTDTERDRTPYTSIGIIFEKDGEWYQLPDDPANDHDLVKKVVSDGLPPIYDVIMCAEMPPVIINHDLYTEVSEADFDNPDPWAFFRKLKDMGYVMPLTDEECTAFLSAFAEAIPINAY